VDRAGGAADVLVHQRAPEVVDPGLQQLAHAGYADLHP